MSEIAKGTLLYCSTPGLGPLVTYDSEIGGGFILVGDPERLASMPKIAQASACAVWSCEVHGHRIHLWHEAKTGDKPALDANGRIQEYGACQVCGERLRRTSALSEGATLAIVCGSCNGTGWVKDLVQEATGIRGTKVCRACLPDSDRA